MVHIERELHRAAMERAILMPSVADGERLGGPRWSARFRSQTCRWVLFRDGRYARTTGTADEQKARAILNVAQLQSDAKEDNLVDCRRAPVQAAMDDRVALMKRKKRKSAEVVESTFKALSPYVEGKALRDLTEDWLEETEEAMREAGLSYSYFWNAINYLRTAIRDYCRVNLSVAVLPFSAPKRAESRKRTVSVQEQAVIMHWSAGSQAYDPATRVWTPVNWISPAEEHRRRITYRQTYLGSMFGSRAGVHAGLSYGPHPDGGGYVDLENAVFHRVKPGTATSANKRSPKVAMPREAVDEIARWREADGGCPWVFPNMGRTGPLGQDRLYVIYAEAMAALGLEDVFMHIWRHTFITRLVERGVSAYAIAEVAGISVQMLNRVYDHHDAADVQKLAHAAMVAIAAPVPPPGAGTS